jgi:glycosyltransferase involved in cell wall biosynthesis
VKILHVNKFLYRRGGAESYMLEVAELQAGRGHDVAFFGMAHPENPPSRFEEHFPPYLSFDPPPPSLADKARVAGRLLYSPAARRGFEEVLEKFEPDIVHLHNIYHQLSPSILRPLQVARIPAVMTLHDYKLACPTYLFLDKGEVCEACLGGRFYQAVLRRCNKGSLIASSLNALELTLHTATKAYSPVHLFVCPSRFIQGKMTEAGVFPERLRHLPNFVDASAIVPKQSRGGGVVYAGRLSGEKGVDTLIAAASGIDAPVDIAGTGPDATAYEAMSRSLGTSKVRFHGQLAREHLHRLVRSAAVVAVPSRCHENQPLIVLEAMACGVPVVATELGGLPELIDPGIDGEIVPPNDPDALALALRSVLEDPDRAYAMGLAGRAKVERMFSVERHIELLDGLYTEAGMTSDRAVA